MTALRIMLPFVDDSTLFFAIRMRDLLARDGIETVLVWFNEDAQISERQMQVNLPGGPDLSVASDVLYDPHFMGQFDALVTGRMFRQLNRLIERDAWQNAAQRPVIIAFLVGLDFTPDKAFHNRRHSDAVFVVPESDISLFKEYSQKHKLRPQQVAFGHPTFLRPDPTAAARDGSGDVYFFAQALSPLTLRGRKHVIAMLAAIARRHQDRDVFVKLRHMPDENRTHVHQERFAYPDLMQDWPEPLPENLKLTACSMDEAAERAGIGITCTSTAAVDLLRAGVPTLISLDYVEHYLDPMAGQMRDLFQGSGLIAPLEDVLNLKVRRPNEDWLNNMLCPRDLGSKVFEVIAEAKEALIKGG